MIGIIAMEAYPLTVGHVQLIRWAKPQVDHLSIIIGTKPYHTISGEVRRGWINELFPDVEVILTPDDLPDEAEPWANRTLQLISPRKPDIVFSNEDYGDSYAKLMSCDHRRYPNPKLIAATAIRHQPANYWEYLESVARRDLCLRIGVLGVDSSGTTTLTNDLAWHFKTIAVTEYGRLYWRYKEQYLGDKNWTNTDFVTIAFMQQQIEEELAKQSRHGLLFVDSPALITCLWQQRYLGEISPEVLKIALATRYDLLLVTAPLPFVQDGTRDQDEQARQQMHLNLLNFLDENGLKYSLVEGTFKRRLETAVSQVFSIYNFPKLER